MREGHAYAICRSAVESITIDAQFLQFQRAIDGDTVAAAGKLDMGGDDNRLA